MSNHLAIATVTATLQRLLQQSVQNSVEGARVTTARPEHQGGAIPDTGIALYLYHLKRNTAFGNADTPGRQRRAEVAKRNQLAIDLYYLLSFYGNDSELETHRLLGSTLQLFEDQTILSGQMIRDTLSDPAYSYLAESDLAEQLEMMRFELLPLSTDELSKIWSVFFQTAHALSVCYKVTVLILEGQDPGQRALPVRDRRLGVSPFGKQPVIEQVFAASGRYDPILASSAVRLHGRMLASPIVQIRLCGTDITPTQVSETDLVFPLSAVPQAALRIGVQSLQVVHPQGQVREQRRSAVQAADRSNLMTLGPIHRSVESNVAPFVLRPTIQQLQVHLEPSLDDELRQVRFEILTDIPVQVGQRVLLCLNERSLEGPHAYVFESDRVESATSALIFRTRHIHPGEYLVRLQVDGAESLLQVDQNPHSPTFEQYIAPLCTIP